jgi:hypothetical protein
MLMMSKSPGQENPSLPLPGCWSQSWVDHGRELTSNVSSEFMWDFTTSFLRVAA